MKKLKTLSSKIYQGKRFFLRADCNIPLHDQDLHLHDYRLTSILPTIDLILNNGGKVILGTHLGRPPALERTNYFDEKLSTQQLIPWFKSKRYEITYEIDLMKAINHSRGSFNQILLLENLRFFNGEHEQNKDFAELLKQCADYYVNDAFGLIHRDDTSITLLPQEFSPSSRFMGILMEKECSFLDDLKSNMPHPFVLIIGGKKVRSKLTSLIGIITAPEEQRPQTILVAGLTALAFFKAQGILDAYPGITEKHVELALHVIDLCHQQNIELCLPSDLITLDDEKNPGTSLITEPQYVHDRCVIDIGPSTIQFYIEKMKKGELLLTAGTAGQCEYEYARQGTQELLCAFSSNKGTTIVGGGDTVAALITFGCQDAISFLSTGGGSLLAYLASSAPYKELPGLKYL